MAVSTLKLTESPFHGTIPLAYQPSSSLHIRFFLYSYPRRTFSCFKPFSSLRSTTESSRASRNPRTRKESYLWDDEKGDVSQDLNHGHQNSGSSSKWINKWPSSPKTPMDSDVKRGEDRTESRYFDGKSGTTSVERIVLRLRNLGLGSDDEEEEEDEAETEEKRNANMEMPVTGEEQLEDLLRRVWVRHDNPLSEEEENESWLPWERMEKRREGAADENDRKETRRKILKAPTVAELTIEDEELRRLRTQGMRLKEKINVAKAGVTAAVLEKIHAQWRRSELVRLKFHEVLAHDMKTAHEIVERRTGGLVIWKSGSVMVVYRGSNYEGPSQIQRSTDAENDNLETDTVLDSDKAEVALSSRLETLTEEEIEYSSLLDGLGPRFEDWWGTGILPVDADMLPQTIPGYKTPFRLLPTRMRPRLTNSEMTNLRKHARSLPCHFALGRNRNHQGLAAAILKLWEKSLVVKIAVKRGIQNTNNKLMADEIKNLTGGVLLLRNKFYIVIYRGKDFVPTSVAVVLAERTEMTKQVQDVEEKVRIKTTEAALLPVDGQVQVEAGSLAEFYEAQAKWGKELTDEDREKMIEEAARAKSSKAVKKVEHKIIIAQFKLLKAEKILAKLEASMIPVGPSDDQETITEEERSMFRKVGLRMKPYLPLGIRGVFDGVIENMHLHWKHRELVKLISKQKNPAFVEETARLLEYESGGVLVTIQRISKGHALIYYRGKNYRRPISLRPRNLLTKAKALKRSVAMQRYEALTRHMSHLEKTIEQMKHEIGDYTDESTINGEHEELANLESVESEDESSWSNSDYDNIDDEDDDEDENDLWDDDVEDDDEDENDIWDDDETTSSDIDKDRH